MERKSWFKIALIMTIMLMLISMPLLAACGGEGDEEPTPTATEEPTEEPTAPPTAAVSEFDVVKDAVAAYVADKAENIKAGDLNDLIDSGDAPYLVSLRSADDYTNGHIPGSVNIAFGDLFKADTLDDTPMDEDIVTYCYTGQTASMAAALLGTLGYDVQNLLHGMCSWTGDAAVLAGKCFNPAADQNDFAVETTANTATETYDYPTLDNTSSTSEAAILQAAAASVSTEYITASDLNDMINSGDAPFIISCRSAEDYANGHIPGAVNIGIGSIADNLDKLPPDETIVVYCYTGHTAAQVTALLNMLGYDAKSLKFGMCSWSSDETVLAGKCFNPSNDQNDFTVAGGAVSESEFDIVKDAVASYVASPAANIKAGDLNDLIADDEAPYLISLRSADDFANGHIPDSVNIAFGDLFKADTLATLPDEEIVTYCYTGQTASMAAALLGTLGYDVQNLLHGMCSWTGDETVLAGKCFNPAADQNDFAVETTANTATETYDYPTLDNTSSTSEAAILQAAAASVSTEYITAGDLNDMIAEDEAPFIISCRSAEDYANGHIPGAVNIGIGSIADNLNKLPPDETIVVYCYTGQTAAQVTALLNMLGYDAKNLKFGMCSWSSDETVLAGKCFDPEGQNDFTIETGA